ncbi:amidohydrolase [Aquamicrobium sp. LC103]|nr:amidohydrolase [Aquamicrobium sp. LC103]
MSRLGAIDCDVHPDAPRRADLMPYLDDYWREMVTSRDVDLLELTSYPTRTPPFNRPDWQAGEGKGVDKLRRNLLDPFGLRCAVLNCVTGVHAIYDPYLAAALCCATNDWLATEWLDRDPRLRASLVVPLQNPQAAVEEIERRAGDKRFVQVLALAMGEMPLGRRFYWPIYEAAERHGFALGIHAGSTYRHAPSQSGFPSHLVEDHVHQSQGFAAQVVSLVAEGVLVKFPNMKVVLIESGVSWLPGLMWRMSKDWRGARIEIPWVKEPPAALIRKQIRMTAQPFDAPLDPAELERIIEHLDADDMLLFATDYPHRHFDGDAALPAGFPERLLDRFVGENALSTYPRLEVLP